MIIKKFQGKTKEDALQQAYTELGPNVVEMNVRNVKKKGIFSFLMPQLVEVTVGLEDDPVRSAKSNDILDAIQGVRKVAEATLIREENENVMEDVIRDGVTYTPSEAGKLAAGVDKSVKENKERAQSFANLSDKNDVISKEESAQPTAIERLRMQKSESSVIEEKLDSLHVMLEAQLNKPEPQPVKEEPAKAVAAPIKESEVTGSNLSPEVSKFVKLLYNTMLDNEVSEKYANQIIEEMEKSITPNTPFELALSNIYQKMILKFGNPDAITSATKGPKVIFFIGPTGVGKTTTIAKIASRLSVEDHKRVVLLTADDYRIAASEQLHTYANILEIPFRNVVVAEDVENAVRDFKGYDYILVDTAGHSQHDEEIRDAMNNIIHSVDGVAEKEVYLVLSATTKYRDLISVADTYTALTKYKLIFTKLDETSAQGNLLNIKLYTGAPLSYVTCGQKVPDDIEVFNPQKTVKQLLGGRR